MHRAVPPILVLVFLLTACSSGGPGGDEGGGAIGIVPFGGGPSVFVNWEHLSVHPVDLTPDGSLLLVCNTAGHRLEVFDVAGAVPVFLASIPVGLDPVSVRARAHTDAGVV
ncbi:MAG: hypothetical protein OER88_04655, partial [Planctomycetota bacterium]|nr:hypothetical protein [Planctomycetota bacterium]